VRRGQRIAAAPLGLHLNPKHWGGKFGDVTAYNPERFLPEAVQARHPNAFVGFGFGLRACIGEWLARAGGRAGRMPET
jgi:cytochrome P450